MRLCLPAAYDQPASVRAAVVPAWETLVTEPAVGFFPFGSVHYVLPATRVVELSDHSVKMGRAHHCFDSEIAFDYAVLATGSSYNNAFQPTRGATQAQIEETFLESQAGIKRAGSILIVGGGPTGVELAGKIAALYPGKKLTIATASASLTPGDYRPKLGSKLASQREKAGVTVHLKAKLDTGALKTGPIEPQLFLVAGWGTVAADFLIICHGSVPNSDLMAALDPSAVSDAGYVRLDAHNARGRALDPLRDRRRGRHARSQDVGRHDGPCGSRRGEYVALLAGKREAELQPWTPALKLIMFGVGHEGGAGQLPLPWFNVVGARVARMIKSRDLFNTQFRAQFEH